VFSNIKKVSVAVHPLQSVTTTEIGPIPTPVRSEDVAPAIRPF
jgi:hypothetical protein